MGGIDAVIFTGGMGENSDFLREEVCEGLDDLSQPQHAALRAAVGRLMDVVGERPN